MMACPPLHHAGQPGGYPVGGGESLPLLLGPGIQRGGGPSKKCTKTIGRDHYSISRAGAMHNNTSGLSFLSEIDGRKTETRLTQIPGNLVLFQGLRWQRDAVHRLILAHQRDACMSTFSEWLLIRGYPCSGVRIPTDPRMNARWTQRMRATKKHSEASHAAAQQPSARVSEWR